MFLGTHNEGKMSNKRQGDGPVAMWLNVRAGLHMLVHILKTFIEAGFWLNPELMDIVTHRSWFASA